MVRVVKIQGGLGNQLFQFAYADYLREFFNQEIRLDTSWFSNRKSDTERHLELTKIIDSFEFTSTWKSNSKLFQRVFPHNYFREGSENCLNPSSDAKYFLGYFQDKKFAERVAKNLSESAIDKLSGPQYERNAVHIRRGDYMRPVALDHHGICSITYFENSVRRLVPIFGILEVDVFSDDSQIFREVQHTGWNISNEINNPFDQIAEMSKYRGLVISNSSFSWWSAQFARDFKRSQIVVAPKLWLANKSPLDFALRYEDWLTEEK